MFLGQTRLTLDALLSDPLTRLVMDADNLTPADVALAFDEARAGLTRARSVIYGQPSASFNLQGEPMSRWTGN